MSATPSSEESFFDGFTVPTKAMFSGMRWVFVGKFFRFVGNSPADARTRQFALRSCSTALIAMAAADSVAPRDYGLVASHDNSAAESRTTKDLHCLFLCGD